MKIKYIKHELEISENLYNVIKDYIYEMDGEIEEHTIDEFIINAIIEKFNNENTIFSGEITQPLPAKAGRFGWLLKQPEVCTL